MLFTTKYAVPRQHKFSSNPVKSRAIKELHCVIFGLNSFKLHSPKGSRNFERIFKHHSLCKSLISLAFIRLRIFSVRFDLSRLHDDFSFFLVRLFVFNLNYDGKLEKVDGDFLTRCCLSSMLGVRRALPNIGSHRHCPERACVVHR